MKIRILLVFILCLFICANSVISQTEDTFTSYTGGFSINLPQDRTGGINGVGSGIRFMWRQPEAEYEIGFHDKQNLSSAVKDGEFSFDELVRRYFNKFSATGNQIYKKEITSDGKSGVEYKYETAKSIFLLRLFLVGDKLYQLQAEIPLQNRMQEEKVLQVFDTFRVLAGEVVRAEMERRIAEATPENLPQSPIAPKAKSDAEDRNLKGKVKSVLSETAHFNVDEALKKKKPTLLEEFDEKGNLLKTIGYNSYGDAFTISVYGYVAGKRVSRTGTIQREYNPGGIALDFPMSEKSSKMKPDNRFDESYKYKYLAGNLVEEITYWNNGFLFRRITHTYLKNKKQTLYYDGGTKPFRKVIFDLDEKGNETKISIFDVEGRKFNALEPFVVEYNAFDEQGNWTQRTVSRFYGFEGKGKYFREYVEYRTIAYY